MPNVELLCDVAEGGRSLAEACKAADAFGLGKNDPKYPRLKILYKKNAEWFAPREVDGKLVECPEPPVLALPFLKGAVLTMGDDGAEKWIAAGLCKVTDKPRSEYVGPKQ